MDQWRTLVTESAEHRTEELRDCESVKFARISLKISHHCSSASQPYFVKR